MSHKSKEFNRITTVGELEKLVSFLRSEEGCPWDRKQTSRSLKPYFLEEVYELMEAIETQCPESLREELGDVLMHICFQVSLAREAGHFGLEDVVATVRDKMIRRHPHVFSDVKFENYADQLFAWEQIKKEEKAGKPSPGKSVLEGLPKDLPALLKSYRIQGRVSKYRFDWDEPLELFSKIDEELKELKDSIQAGRSEAVEEEIGDLLFTIVNLSRLLGVHPQLALERTNRKFIRRFKELEKLLHKRGKVLGELSLEELDAVWEEVKKNERTRVSD
ncbi:MAG: nucleoside triphosphate pyrophosphohydrolase [Deltaproteobacteria bacterium]|nr:MAG: nucleoside triphosphate pyrophosphohydrolase [Deltaproteobacteria bacterium]